MKNAALITALLSLSAAMTAQAQEATTNDGKGQELSEAALAAALASGVANLDTPSRRPPVDVNLPGLSLDAGGIVAGEHAEISTDVDNTVVLTNNTQQDAKAMNLVNSSGSIVGSGTNIWAGSFRDGDLIDLVPLSLNSDVLGEQNNLMMQTDGNSANVVGFNDYATGNNTTTSSSSSTKEHASVTAGNNSTSVLDGLLYDSNESVGRGLATSGGANLHVDAGSVDVGGSITTKAGVAWGLLSGETTMKADLNVELPKLDLDFAGTACAGLDGASCDSGRDASSSSSSSSTLSSAPRDTIGAAQATIIAKDYANVQTTETNLVQLSDNAQQNAQGMNIVNASGSMVSNGVNIARTTGMSFMASSVSTVRQNNVIVQSR